MIGRCIFIAIGSFVAGLLWTASSPTRAAAQYTLRRSIVVDGSYAVTGNWLLECPVGRATCDNNDTALVPIDVDPLALGDLDANGTDDTVSSSAATLALPVGASVRFAYLFVNVAGYDTVSGTIHWTPETTPALYPVRLATTGGAYATVTPENVTLVADMYQARYDVTSLVTGAGEYWVADVVLPPAAFPFNQIASWTLVVAYAQSGAPTKLINIYDGAFVCAGSTTTFDVTGFRTPSAGAVTAAFTTWGADGLARAVGESGSVGSLVLTNADNPLDNLANSSVSTPLGPIPRTPSTFRVSESIDIDTFDVSAAFTNSQTSTTMSFTCSAADGIYWEGGVIAIDVQVPHVTFEKSVTDLDGGMTAPGDELEYVLDVRVLGVDDATFVTLRDPIPAGTTYVPGSIEYLEGPTLGAMTDATDTDLAELTGGALVMRVGTGANATMGGTIAIGGRVRVRFHVRVDDVTVATTVSNTAVAAFRGAAMGTGGTIVERESSAPGGAGPTTIGVVPCSTPGAGCALDAGPGAPDAGIGGVDAGTTTDAGGGRPDAGSLTRDGGGLAADAGSGTGGTVDDGGCGCRVAARPTRTSHHARGGCAIVLLVGLALARRRSRR